MIEPVLFAFLLMVTCLLAFTLGGPSERIGSLVGLIGAVISVLVEHPLVRRWHETETGLLVVDLVMLGAFATIMLFSKRFWPVWATAFQLLTVAAHISPFCIPAGFAKAFAIDEQGWGWVIQSQIITASSCTGDSNGKSIKLQVPP